MDFRSRVNSFLKPLSSVNPPIEVARSSESHRYLDGELTTKLQLGPERRAEFDKRYRALQAERDGTAAKATEAFNAVLKQITRARDIAIHSTADNFDRALWNLFAEFKTPMPVSAMMQKAIEGQKASSIDAGLQQAASLKMSDITQRRRQPIPASEIPDKVAEVLAERAANQA